MMRMEEFKQTWTNTRNILLGGGANRLQGKVLVDDCEGAVSADVAAHAGTAALGWPAAVAAAGAAAGAFLAGVGQAFDSFG